MRIARFLNDRHQIQLGALIDERSVRVIDGDVFGQHRVTDQVAAIHKLLPPVAPPNIFAIGRNYRAHAEELGNKAPEQPLVFMKPTTSLLAPGDAIRIPRSAPEQVDYEAELAIVIGRTARNVAVADALQFALGYTCANDVSARDCQKNDKQWARAKGFDTFCPLGPWLVTADSLNPDNCRIRTRLNGQTMQDANTGQMVHSCAALISYLSHQFTLLPGTLILTGTPEGVGLGRTPPVFLKPGDQVEVEIDGIGVLANKVAASD